MCIARCRLHLCMAKQFSDHRETLTKRQSAGGERVAEIVILVTVGLLQNPPLTEPSIFGSVKRIPLPRVASGRECQR